MPIAPEDGHDYISPHHIIQRPKVQYSDADQKYHVSLYVALPPQFVASER